MANLEKKTVFDQDEICFLFQLLKLRKIRGKNWRDKLTKTSDEFVNVQDRWMHFKLKKFMNRQFSAIVLYPSSLVKR